MFNAEEAVEDLAERADVVQVVEDDRVRQLAGAVLTLVGDVGEVLAQFLARLVIDVERRDGPGSRLLARPDREEDIRTVIRRWAIDKLKRPYSSNSGWEKQTR